MILKYKFFSACFSTKILLFVCIGILHTKKNKKQKNNATNIIHLLVMTISMISQRAKLEYDFSYPKTSWGGKFLSPQQPSKKWKPFPSKESYIYPYILCAIWVDTYVCTCGCARHDQQNLPAARSLLSISRFYSWNTYI